MNAEKGMDFPKQKQKGKLRIVKFYCPHCNKHVKSTKNLYLRNHDTCGKSLIFSVDTMEMRHSLPRYKVKREVKP